MILSNVDKNEYIYKFIYYYLSINLVNKVISVSIFHKNSYSKLRSVNYSFIDLAFPLLVSLSTNRHIIMVSPAIVNIPINTDPIKKEIRKKI